MALSARSVRIISASALSVVLIGGAYAISGPIPVLTSKTANAQSTDELLKAYAAKDSDSDGLPDWQEALYGTDPNNAHSVNASLTDAEAVSKGLVTPKTSAQIPTVTQPISPTDAAAEVPGPDPVAGSLTDQFGKEFIQEFMAASGNGQQLTADQQQALITKLMASYTEKAIPLLTSSYTSVSIHVSPSATVSTYVGSIEQVFRTNDVPKDASNPFTLVQAYFQNNDLTAQKKLLALSNAYASITRGLLAVQVPASLASQHLALVRSFDTLAHVTKAQVNYTSDPLAALGSVALVAPTWQTLIDTFQSIAKAVLANGEPGLNDPGALIVQTARAQQG
jgi:hypothetical protein